jgi:hypothetical protein
VVRLRAFLRSRVFKGAVVLALLVLAIRLKGEPLTVTALVARVVDLLAEVGLEGTVNKE